MRLLMAKYSVMLRKQLEITHMTRGELSTTGEKTLFGPGVNLFYSI